MGETRGDDTTPDSNKSEGLANCTSTVLVDEQNQKTDIENEPEVTIAEPREGSDKAMDPLDEIKCSVCYNGDNEENKGEEAALTVLEMLAVFKQMQSAE